MDNPVPQSVLVDVVDQQPIISGCRLESDSSLEIPCREQSDASHSDIGSHIKNGVAGCIAEITFLVQQGNGTAHFAHFVAFPHVQILPDQPVFAIECEQTIRSLNRNVPPGSQIYQPPAELSPPKADG